MELTLRPTTEADLDFVYEAEQAPENRRYIVPWSRDRHGEALANPNLIHWIVELDRPIGYIIVAGMGDPSRSLELRRMVITEKGQGYGRRSLEMLVTHAFEQLKVHRVWLEVKDFDVRARALYRTMGFVEEGILRESNLSPEGDYESMVIMGMLKREYEAQWL